MGHLTKLLPLTLMLGSCSTALQPPHADESTRRPVNQAAEVGFQACRNELHNLRILGEEERSQSESLAATLRRCLRKQSSEAQPATSTLPPSNQVLVIHFAFASSDVRLTNKAQTALFTAARGAPWIVLRGRTDGVMDNLADSRLARDRANAVRDHLVAAGVDGTRIRTTYQAIGDPLLNRAAPGGRHANRRVEVEIYRSAPAQAAPINTAG